MVVSHMNQKDFWSSKGGEHWVEHQASMNIMLGSLGEAALQKLNLKKGQHVLDIGCGCGETTLNIATKIGPSGNVTGLDISEPMLKSARKSALELLIANTSFQCIDVETGDLGEHIYSSAFSRFGVMFFDDPIAAFKNIYTSLIPGASLAFVCWQSPELNPWHSLLTQEIKKFIDLPPSSQDSPGPFAFMASDYVASVLEQSNFQAIAIEGYEADVTLFSGRNLATAIRDRLSINPVVTQMLKGASAQTIDHIVDSAVEAYSPYCSEKGVVLPGATWLVTARK